MSKTPKPVLGSIAPTTSKTPKLSSESKKKWAFSFRYWRQIDNFGLNRTESNWFVSLMDKLSELSKKEVSDFVANGSEKDSWRYHPINWMQKNIPIQRSQLDWIQKDYLENETEYPLLQFQISKALGRVVGFWDEHQIFNIVLLDPLHNIQPSKDFDYRVNYCTPLDSEFALLHKRVVDIKNTCNCSDPECNFRKKLNDFDNIPILTNAVFHFIEDNDLTETENLIKSGVIKSATEVYSWGIAALKDEMLKQ